MKKTTVTSIILAGALCAGAIYYYQVTRPTRLTVSFDGMPAAQTQVGIATGSADIIGVVREDYRSVTDPLHQAIKTSEERLAQIESAIKDVDNQKLNLERKISETEEKLTAAVKDTWDNESKELEEELADSRKAFATMIEQKARDLQLSYVRNDKVESPEAWMSAYRLTLYNAPTNVNAVVERKWSETELAKWRQYETEWQNRMNAAMQKGKALDEKKKNAVASLQSEFPVAQRKREPLVIQQERLAAELAALKAQLDAVPKDTYCQRIRELHKARAVMNQTTGPDGSTTFEELKLPPGEYYIVAERETPDGTLLWYQKFELKARKHNKVALTKSNAMTVEKLLEK